MSVMRARTALFAILCFSALAALPRGQTSTTEVVLWASQTAARAGGWTVTADSTAAGGESIRHPNASAPKISAPLQTPQHYFELEFDVQAGVPYHLWLRGKADANHYSNDAVYAQFSGSVTSGGTPTYRIGSTSAAIVVIEDCSGCGLNGWGWQDNGFGVDVLGPDIYFATTGAQTLRIQTREDGLAIDQVVMSPARYLTSAPGAKKDDTTILTPGEDLPAATLVRGPYLQQATSDAMTIVWATREPGPAQVEYGTAGSSSRLTSASSRVRPGTTTGLAYDYYQHEASVEGLEPDTIYAYRLLLAGAPVGAAAGYRFTTASAPDGDVRFIIFGDSGTGSNAQRELASVMDADTFDLALHGGDIAYGNSGGTGDATWRTYHDWFFQIYDGWLSSRPFFPAEGNHDSRPSNGDGAAYLDLFALPRNGASPGYADHAERYYSFDYGPVHFVALDTEFAFQDSTRRAAQLSWLEGDLAGAAAPWKVAFYHRSPFSAGADHGSDLAVRAAFAPIFERYGVQLSLSAHEHDYERSDPVAVAGGAPVVYVVSGGGGGPLYPAGSGWWTAYSASRHHYVRVTADPCTLRVEAVGLSGSVFDATSIARCGEPGEAPDVVLYATDAGTRAGGWTLETDASAADDRRLRHPNAGAAKIGAPLAAPQHYFDIDFEAQGGVPYHLWIRGRADSDHYTNDAAYVQFSGSVSGSGAAVNRIGTTSAEVVVVEDCSGCGLRGWGWQDNGYGTLGAHVRFAQSGPQRLRVQTREDGLAIDQIVLSPATYLTARPGALKDDDTIVPR